MKSLSVTYLPLNCVIMVSWHIPIVLTSLQEYCFESNGNILLHSMCSNFIIRSAVVFHLAMDHPFVALSMGQSVGLSIDWWFYQTNSKTLKIGFVNAYTTET